MSKAMYKATILRSNGTSIEIYSENRNDLIEIVSIAFSAVKPFYRSAEFYDQSNKNFAVMHEDGKYQEIE